MHSLRLYCTKGCQLPFLVASAFHNKKKCILWRGLAQTNTSRHKSFRLKTSTAVIAFRPHKVLSHQRKHVTSSRSGKYVPQQSLLTHTRRQAIFSNEHYSNRNIPLFDQSGRLLSSSAKRHIFSGNGLLFFTNALKGVELFSQFSWLLRCLS